MTTTTQPTTDTNRSKVVLFFQNDANKDNNKPALKGMITLAGGTGYTAALWSGDREDGKGLYLTGQVTAQDAIAALRSRHDAIQAPQFGVAPPGLDLTPGQIVLFETPKEQMAENAKRPNFYGYMRTADGYYRLAAWNSKTGQGAPMLAGNIQVNQQWDGVPEPTTPQQRAPKTRAPRAGQGTA